MGRAPLTTRKGSQGKRTGSLTTADLIVLSLLAERAMHGYELLGEYERQEVADWASVSKAQVYYAIQKLAGLKLIAPLKEPSTERERDRTVYAPTKRGRAELTTSLNQTSWAEARIAQPFSTWLGLSIHLEPDAVGGMLRARQKFLGDELARERDSLAFIRTLTSPRARAGDAIVRLVIRQLEVESDWIDDMLKSPGPTDDPKAKRRPSTR
jgi:DNA-binding PadR family transcriptional regulator